MNDFQKVQLDLLRHFIDICDKLNINYYLVHGSLLGAIKYKGFIPWDDDIDVAMKRTDYDRFKKYAGEYLPNNVFLQNNDTDPFFPRFLMRLQNLDTTWIDEDTAHLDIKKGIFIDIFSINGCPPKKNEKKYCKRRKHLSRVFVVHTNKKISYRMGLRTRVIKFLHDVFGVYSNIQKNVKKYEKLTSEYSTDDREYWFESMTNPKTEKLESSWFNDVTYAEFEGIKVKIPSNYDAYLTKRYGDWKADLPDDQKYGHHFALVMDAHKSYTEYINEK